MAIRKIHEERSRTNLKIELKTEGVLRAIGMETQFSKSHFLLMKLPHPSLPLSHNTILDYDPTFSL